MGIRTATRPQPQPDAPQRIERLEGLPGWAWNVVDARWETNFAALAAYADAHGHSYRRAPRIFTSTNG